MAAHLSSLMRRQQDNIKQTDSTVMLLYIMWNVNDHKEHASHMTVTSDFMTDLAYLNGYSTAPKLSSV